MEASDPLLRHQPDDGLPAVAPTHRGHLSKEHRAEILLDVNIDSVGLAGPIRAWTVRSDDLLLTSAAVVADRIKVGIGGEALDRRYDSDAGAFIAWKIPVIDFHSLRPDTLHLLHSEK